MLVKARRIGASPRVRQATRSSRMFGGRRPCCRTARRVGRRLNKVKGHATDARGAPARSGRRRDRTTRRTATSSGGQIFASPATTARAKLLRQRHHSTSSASSRRMWDSAAGAVTRLPTPRSRRRTAWGTSLPPPLVEQTGDARFRLTGSRRGHRRWHAPRRRNLTGRKRVATTACSINSSAASSSTTSDQHHRTKLIDGAVAEHGDLRRQRRSAGSTSAHERPRRSTWCGGYLGTVSSTSDALHQSNARSLDDIYRMVNDGVRVWGSPHLRRRDGYGRFPAEAAPKTFGEQLVEPVVKFTQGLEEGARHALRSVREGIIRIPEGDRETPTGPRFASPHRHPPPATFATTRRRQRKAMLTEAWAPRPRSPRCHPSPGNASNSTERRA